MSENEGIILGIYMSENDGEIRYQIWDTYSTFWFSKCWVFNVWFGKWWDLNVWFGIRWILTVWFGEYCGLNVWFKSLIFRFLLRWSILLRYSSFEQVSIWMIKPYLDEVSYLDTHHLNKSLSEWLSLIPVWINKPFNWNVNRS